MSQYKKYLKTLIRNFLNFCSKNCMLMVIPNDLLTFVKKPQYNFLGFWWIFKIRQSWINYHWKTWVKWYWDYSLNEQRKIISFISLKTDNKIPIAKHQENYSKHERVDKISQNFWVRLLIISHLFWVLYWFFHSCKL